jgi:hypothetical protein
MTTDGGLRQLFRHHLPIWDWQPIETAAISPGVPDLNGCWEGREVWVEMKQTRGWAVKFQPMQPGLITRRVAHGGHVFIAVRHQSIGADALHIYHGRSVLDLQAQGLRAPGRLLLGIGSPARWDWNMVHHILSERF